MQHLKKITTSLSSKTSGASSGGVGAGTSELLLVDGRCWPSCQSKEDPGVDPLAWQYSCRNILWLLTGVEIVVVW